MKDIRHLSEEHFRRRTGVKPETFERMLGILERAYAAKKNKGGRPSTLGVAKMLLMTLEYLKEYRTLECIGASYGLTKANVGKTIKWVEEALLASGLFSLPSKRKLVQSKPEIEVIVVDTVETPIQRPKSPKKQKAYYSGKKNDIP